MKNKILTFIIGVLIGAIIASIGFYAYSKTHQKSFTPGDMPEMSDRNGGTPPDLPDGVKGGPGGNKDGNSSVPEKTSDDNQTSSDSQNSEN